LATNKAKHGLQVNDSDLSVPAKKAKHALHEDSDGESSSEERVVKTTITLLGLNTRSKLIGIKLNDYKTK
jgi:hypothetical protein